MAYTPCSEYADCGDCPGANVRPTRRRGAIIVELVLALPVLIIGLLAVLEFGVMMANFQQISLAARDGALVASETTGLDSAANVPASVVNVVQLQLAGANMTPCRILLEHNDGGTQNVLDEQFGAGCNCGPAAVLSPQPSQPYVRVTVCVEMTQVAPNTLKNFGFDLTGRMAEFTTVMRLENPTP